jgi:hypothetical protein
MHYHNSNSTFGRIFAIFGNLIRFEFEFLCWNSYSPNIRELEYEFELGEFSPTPASDLIDKSHCSESDSKRMIGVPYREAIGSLHFLAVITRPDIDVAVSILSTHVQCPRPGH